MSNVKIKVGSSSGIGCLGIPLAAMLSIKSWGFTWWLLLHIPCGWFYVIYWCIFVSGWIK